MPCLALLVMLGCDDGDCGGKVIVVVMLGGEKARRQHERLCGLDYFWQKCFIILSSHHFIRIDKFKMSCKGLPQYLLLIPKPILKAEASS